MPAQMLLPDVVRPALALTGAAWRPGPGFVGADLDRAAGNGRQQNAGVSAPRGRGWRRDSWDGEPVVNFGCRFRDLPAMLPAFERAPFSAPGGAGRANPHFDLIVRSPDAFLPVPVPVAAVSKAYKLVQHRDAMEAVGRALAGRRLAAEDLQVETTISEFGRRLACSVRLPRGLDFVERDGTRMALTIECFNSVDGLSAFRVLAGWFRFVCTNGLIVGNSKLDFRRAHAPSLRLEHVEAALSHGLRAADLERLRFARWQQEPAPWPRVVAWAESTVATKWGVIAAARVLHIARTGRDATPVNTRWHGGPAAWPMIAGDDVPGSAPPADTVYRVAQVLAWMAGQTGEVAARVERRSQVLGLVRHLASATGGRSLGAPPRPPGPASAVR